MEQLVEWELTAESEVLGENLARCHFVHHKSHIRYAGTEVELAQWEDRDKPPELCREY
jgi:hypothetical protein